MKGYIINQRMIVKGITYMGNGFMINRGVIKREREGGGEIENIPKRGKEIIYPKKTIKANHNQQSFAPYKHTCTHTHTESIIGNP